MKTTSIIPGPFLLLLLLLTEIGTARNIWSADEDSALQPILSQSHQTRICSELCLSGLGGTPCGDTCFDLMPSMPIVSSQDQQGGQKVSSNANHKSYNATTRKGSCDVLCKNKLGYPLCACTYDDSKPYATDFVEVCSTFCLNYGYQLYGCQNCTVYSQYYNKSKNANSAFDTASLNVGTKLAVSWTAWCRDVCSDGNGGAACNCDLLP